MNPDTNRFEQLTAKAADEQTKTLREGLHQKLVRPDGTPVPDHWTQFQIGEHVVIKDYTFRVAYIGETAILFEPVGVPIVGEDPTP